MNSDRFAISEPLRITYKCKSVYELPYTTFSKSSSFSILPYSKLTEKPLIYSFRNTNNSIIES